jgi:hypothetical protein
MLSYPARISAMLAHAPPAPPLKRKPTVEAAGVSDETKAKLLIVHSAAAMFAPHDRRHDVM